MKTELKIGNQFRLTAAYKNFYGEPHKDSVFTISNLQPSILNPGTQRINLQTKNEELSVSIPEKVFEYRFEPLETSKIQELNLTIGAIFRVKEEKIAEFKNFLIEEYKFNCENELQSLILNIQGMDLCLYKIDTRPKGGLLGECYSIYYLICSYTGVKLPFLTQKGVTEFLYNVYEEKKKETEFNLPPHNTLIQHFCLQTYLELGGLITNLSLREDPLIEREYLYNPMPTHLRIVKILAIFKQDAGTLGIDERSYNYLLTLERANGEIIQKSAYELYILNFNPLVILHPKYTQSNE